MKKDVHEAADAGEEAGLGDGVRVASEPADTSGAAATAAVEVQ